ncbi:MAG: sugar transferase [Patescibacteria group bacterium]|nr:sugar transferase [Patescibacteria group bacterium]
MSINTDLKLKIKRFVLIFGDIIILYFSLFLTLFIRFYKNFSKELYVNHVIYFTITYLIWFIMIFSFRFYETHKPIKKPLDIIINIVYFSLINLFLSVLYFYLTPNQFITPKTILVLNIIIFDGLFFLWRNFANKFLYRYSLKQNCLVITNSEYLINSIKQKPELNLNIKKFINPNSNINLWDLEKITLDELNNFSENNKIQNIIIDDELLFDEQISKILLKHLNLKIEIIKTSDFYEKFLGKVAIKNINQVWIISNFNENKKYIFDIFKNIFDLIFGVIFLIISIILIPFIIIAIKLDSKGPILFMQIRTGKNGKDFLAMKFRTMCVDAEKNGAQWAQENDSRITHVGNFLRKTRLDEIPQLINILRGEMSLIGPRPERPEFIKTLEKQIPYYNQRLLVRPGLTGWAQINYPYGSSIEDVVEKLEYDLYYVKNRSIALDVSIILKTLNTVIKAQGR